MRFKKLPLQQFVIALSATYILQLAINNRLIFYIHPRYIIFTITLSIICLAIALADYTINKPLSEKVLKLSNLPILIILLVALFLPAQSLTSSTVSQRSIDGINTATQSNTTNLFAQSSRALSIQDWTRLLATNKDISFYSNKTPQISGFVYDARLGGDTLQLSRFVVTCCAVDAQPLGIPIYIENWEEKYSQDQWLEVTGTFEERETTNGKQIVIIPGEVKEIEEPENPYAN